MTLRVLPWMIALALALPACGEQAQAPSAARQLLNLGLLMTEGSAKAPNGPRRGVELAISEYNRHRDSTYQVRLRSLTGDGSPATASQLAARLTGTERLIGTVAALSGDETAAAARAFEQASIPFLATSADGEVAEGSRTFRRLVGNMKQEGAAVARYVMGRVNVPAIIFHDGTPAGSAFVDGAKEALEAAKRPIQSSQRISARTDLEGVLGSVPREAPSFVLFGGEGGLGAAFADVLRKGGYEGLVVASHHTMDARPTGVPDGLVAASVVANPDDRQLRSFNADYSAKFKAMPGPLAAESYEGALMLLEAVEEVEPKPREIVDFFQLSRSFLGDTKSFDYDENGELEEPAVWIYGSKGGAWTFSGRFERPRRGSSTSE